jgi:hypothetical protein
MHTAGIVFLWLNRVYFTCVIVLYVAGVTPRRGFSKQHGIALLVVSLWQIFGTFMVVALNRTPFHLIWWYALGWSIYGIVGAIATDVRRSRSRDAQQRCEARIEMRTRRNNLNRSDGCQTNRRRK